MILSQMEYRVIVTALAQYTDDSMENEPVGVALAEKLVGKLTPLAYPPGTVTLMEPPRKVSTAERRGNPAARHGGINVLKT